MYRLQRMDSIQRGERITVREGLGSSHDGTVCLKSRALVSREASGWLQFSYYVTLGCSAGLYDRLCASSFVVRIASRNVEHTLDILAEVGPGRSFVRLLTAFAFRSFLTAAACLLWSLCAVLRRRDRAAHGCDEPLYVAARVS